jgi:hypothetical protein
LTDFGEPAAAGSASENPREKVARSASTFRAYASILGHDLRPKLPLALLDQFPQMIVNDAKLRHTLDDPFVFRVKPRLPPTSIWVLDKLLTVPNQPTDIQFVVENPCAAPPVAVDRGRPPGPAGGTGDLFFVKGTGDRSWRATFREFFEDPANYRGFNLIDAAFATDGLAGRIDTANDVVAKA